MPRIAIVHPWLPQYRLRFFEDLVDRLARDGVETTVMHGDAPPEVRARRDDGSTSWALRLPSRHLVRGTRRLTLKRLPRDVADRDLVIVEQAIGNLETYPLLVRSLASSTRVAFWGHGRTFTKPCSAAEERLKQLLTRQGSWFFSYTAGGARHVVRAGFDARRVTVVNNTLDTDELARAVRHAETAGLACRVAAELSVDPMTTCLFVGGLDESKRLPFVLAAAEQISRAVPTFSLIVAGDGRHREAVERTTGSVPWLRYLGRVDAARKAALASVARLLLMPGRVGLVSVDSFVLATPIVTTDWPWHAPEFEYLVPGVNSVLTPDDVASYSSTVVDLLRQPDRVDELSRRCRSSAEHYTLEQMVEKFAGGVRGALAA